MKISTLAASVAAIAVAGAATLGAAPAQAQTLNGSTYGAADWITSQLDGGVLATPYDGELYPDYGDSITTATGLDAIGGFARDQASIVSAIKADFADYTTGASYGEPSEISAGATAKAIVSAQLAGGTAPAAWVTRLESLVQPSGRIQDGLDPSDAYDSDYANVIGQAYAADALSAAGSAKAASATAFLLSQQCTAGWFRESFTQVDGANTDSSCTADTSSTPSVDATAFAVLDLLPQASNPTVETAITTAAAWLVSVQQDDGGWTDGTSTGVENTNSTGLATWALGEVGTSADLAAAATGAAWVSKLQVTPALECAHPALLWDEGALAYDQSALSAAEKSGITDGTLAQWQSAGSQATPALAYLDSPAPIVSGGLSGPQSYQRAGATITLHVTGVGSGDACLAGPGYHKAAVDGGNTVTLPNRTETATYALHELGAIPTVQVGVLGKLTIRPRLSASSVKRGKSVKVSVAGLASGESVKIYLRGKKVATGFATGGGAFSKSIKVTGAKGRAAIKVVGQFSDRRGSTTVTVK